MEEDEWDDALLSEIEALESRHLQSNNRQHESVTAAAGAWSCRSCTLQNEASRTTCLVCLTPRGRSYQAPAPAASPVRASTAPKKTVQATLSFDGTSTPVAPSQQQEQSIGRSEPSPFSANREQTVLQLTPKPGLVMTSRRSGDAPTAISTVTSASSPVQMQRHAAGEDAKAKTRYLDIVARSNFPQIDYEAAQSFVYPTNYSIRDYQLTIAEKALYHNTLVSLPTGLGKTLVAAVVMYNFYRWFPTGKIVFMAPTKPLVAQQIKACHEIMGIPLSDTAELQGNVPPTMRRVLWNSRRVFFCTPQSLQNDLRRGVCAAEKFVCIVVDEAHRATGNYAYCCVVQEIESKTQFFRVLALSATPGAKFDVIQEVVTNMRISHIESRSADDADVKKYTHARQEEVIVCRLGAQILEVKTQFLKFFPPIIQRLLRANIIQNSDPEKLSSWYVLQARERFRKSPNYSTNRSAESDLALLVSLLHAKSLLTGHGLSSFREQIMSWAEDRKKGKMSWSKRELVQSKEFQALELSLAVRPGSSSSTDTASHPKLVKLREVLLEHFQRHAVGKSSTRAIVFTQFRASVSEIVALLRPLAPLLNVQPFIGQGASGKAKENKGQTQKVQQEIVRRFRLGEFNVLVATCIAEEGLDIGEVDLIVSFDALTSPVRMIQRMGRTGRKRVGRVIILVTEGDEQKKLARSASAAKTVSRALTTFKNRFTYSKSPRMLPTGICPTLRELQMKIPTFHASQVGGKAASGEVDPDLWQLNDAERAIALMKYFPPNFASSSRNRIFPVIANRAHLLRPQQRSLVRNGVSRRVGYSFRSLMLQHLVRKINGVEEVLDSESDYEDDKNDGNGNQFSDVNSSNITQRACTDKDDLLKSSRLKASENRRRSSMSTSNANTDNEMGSPFRPTSTPSGLEDGSRCDDSFSVMDESVNCVDMHFSPQFVDPTQLTPAVEGVEPFTKVNKRQRESHDQISSPKRQKNDVKHQGLPEVVCLPSGSSVTLANTDGKATAAEGVAVDAPGDQLASMENFETGEKSQQMSATLSLTLTSDSPRPPAKLCGEIRQQNVTVEMNNITDSTQQLPIVPRSAGTRQLQFDDDEGEEDELDQTPSAEMPQSEHTILAPPSDKHDVPLVEDEEPHPSSFALLPPPRDTIFVAKPEGVLDDGEQAEAEPSAYSFALLPPLDKSTEVAPESPDAIARSKRATSQPVDDATDGDELDEPHEPNSVVNIERSTNVGLTASVDATVVDLTSEVATQHEVKAKPEVPIVSPRPNADTCATHQALSNQKGSEPEHEDEGGCSICMESESYDDDPIVFCDGCNTAVHQFCYGIRTVPRNKWFCEVCKEAQKTYTGSNPRQPSCQLCPQRGGAFKRTECGQWVHVQCFLWIPEFRVEEGEDDMLVLGPVDSLDSDRKTLDCSLCHSAKGHGIIQCAHKRCMAAFHVSCAAYAHYRMDQLDPPDGEGTGSGTRFIAYCPLHRNSTAQVNIPEQQKTPPAAKSRLLKPPLPTSATKTSSPSHLLVSPSSAEAKKKFKTFRRLKRKYDASQSQIFTQPGTKGSPTETSPWQKRIRRSKRRRETSRALAIAFIDDAAEVRGGARGDDDDEDDYGDDYKDAADDSFINDSSQLLYSQSVESPEDAGSGSTKKRKRKKSSPNMRAIYARSLFESQNSPLLLRRGGRHLAALPSNGIIRACLNELHNGPTEVDTPSPRPRSRSRLLDIPEGAEATPMSASATVTEAEEDDSATEAEPSPSFDLLDTAKAFSVGENEGQVQTKNKESSGDLDVAPPSFSLLGGNVPHLEDHGTGLPRTTTQQPTSEALTSSKLLDAGDVHKKIEANRLKALKKLEERRRQAKLQQRQQPPSQLSPENKVSVPQSGRDQSSNGAGQGFTSAATLVSRNTHGDAKTSFRLLASTTSRGPLTPVRGDQVSTVDLTSPKAIVPESTSRSNQPPNWIVFVSPSFASSSSFPVFASTKQAGCTVAIDDSLEVDVLLSVRMGVLFLTAQQLHELALSAPAQNVVKSRRVRTMLTMHKKIVVAVVHDGGDPPEVLRLRLLPHATVIVQPRPESLCAALHQLAQQELAQGYELPSPSLCRSDFKGGVVGGLDADFASRLEFFRSIPLMSLGSALSLSFRFKNFAAALVPVLKFNEMHWRRMLPWISEATAEAIRRHVQQNARRSGAD